MDDLLKVFFWETSECIAACWLAVERLRQVPDDTDSFEDMLDQFRTMRETSRFLGMSALQAAANAVLESLESAKANRPSGMDRIMPIAVDGLRRIEAVVKGMMIADAAMAEETPVIRPPAESAAEALRSKSAARSPSGPRRRHTSGLTRKGGPARTQITESDEFDDVEAAESEPSLATAGRPAVESNVAAMKPTTAGGAATDGTVRIDAETLNYLVSTVRNLAESQAELMRMLAAKESTTAGRDDAVVASVPPPATPIGDATEAAEPQPSVPQSATRGTIRYLVFQAADGVRRAVPLDRVESLEEVELKAIDNARGLWVTRWSGNLLPLIPFDPGYTLPEEGLAPIIVFRIGGQYFGMLVGNVPQTAAGDAGPAAGAACVTIDGDSVDVVDPAAFFERYIKGRMDRRRRGSAKSLKLQAASRPAIPEDDNLFVRKTTR